jgi:20S proteasome alpha/beta subunit
MSFENYWEQLCRANPPLCDPDEAMRITVASLRKAIERAYHQGRADALVEKLKQDTDIDESDMPDFFKGLFK